MSAVIVIPGFVELQRRTLQSAVYSETGGDILLQYPVAFPNQPTGSHNPPLAALAKVPEVKSFTYASSILNRTGLIVVLFDPATYRETLRADMVEYGNNMVAALQRVARPNAAIANTAAAESLGLSTGSSFANLTMVGVVPRMPGLQEPARLDVPTLFTAYENLAMPPTATDITRVLVRVTALDGAARVQSNLLALAPTSNVENAPAELRGLSQSSIVGPLASLSSTTVFALSFIVATAFASSAIISAAELQRDVARMRARGLQTRHGSKIIARLIVGGAIASVVAGAGLGTTVLFCFSWLTGHLGLFPDTLSAIALAPGSAFVAFCLAVAVTGSAFVSRRLTSIRSGGVLREREL